MAAERWSASLDARAERLASLLTLSAANGRIDLQWSHEAGGGLHLRWTETGGPAVETPTRKGFGARVIEQMIAQLKGKTCFDWRAEGLVCEITLPPLMPTGATQPTGKGA